MKDIIQTIEENPYSSAIILGGLGMTLNALYLGNMTPSISTLPLITITGFMILLTGALWFLFSKYRADRSYRAKDDGKTGLMIGASGLTIIAFSAGNIFSILSVVGLGALGLSAFLIGVAASIAILKKYAQKPHANNKPLFTNRSTGKITVEGGIFITGTLFSLTGFALEYVGHLEIGITLAGLGFGMLLTALLNHKVANSPIACEGLHASKISCAHGISINA